MVVNVALSVLQSVLRVTLADVQWVVESYALFLAALLLIGGSLGDMYDRRKIFVMGVVTFTAASVWCGLSRNIDQLIVGRGLQGIGGALLVPGSLALISVNFPEDQRGRAIGRGPASAALASPFLLLMHEHDHGRIRGGPAHGHFYCAAVPQRLRGC
jgi:MFS family permease